MAVPLFGSGVRNNTQLTRSLERVLEEAHLTGELYLSGRNLKEFPKVASKYDLEDTVSVDLSKNRLTELPPEVCDFVSIENIDCYHNVIRSVPDNVVQLKVLTHLNLSRNQLTSIPSSLCQLHMLHVLLLCYNKLGSLPEEISQLQKLMDLDVSCNEISHLPTQIGYLKSLRSLNLRRNLIAELPNEITMLRLSSLDISCNRIVHLPPRLRIMESLSVLFLSNNPLSCPSAYLCTRGKVHIFKFLDIQAQRDDHKKGSLGMVSEYIESPHRQNSSIDLEANGFLTNSHSKNSQNESGYCNSEIDQRWSQYSQDEYLIRQRPNSRLDQTLMKSKIEDGVLLAEECRKASSKILELQQEESRRNSSQHKANSTNPTDVCSTLNQRKDYLNYNNGCEISTSSSPLTMAERNNKPLEFTQTYKEYKEALKLQRSIDTNNVYRRVQPDTGGIANQVNNLSNDNSSYALLPSGISASNHVSYNEEYPLRQPDVFTDQRHDTQSPPENHLRLDDEKRKQKLMQKEAVLSYIKSRTSPLRSSVGSDIFSSPSPLPPPMPASAFLPSVALHIPNASQSVNSTINQSSAQNFRSPQFAPVNQSYTLRRESERAREDKELIELLRQAIETRLKVSLPEDLASALTDGVVLCHLANHVRPRSIASIHVPSPAVPKLTVAKCRRNIENFLEACRRIGVAEEHLCTCDDILHGLREPRNVMACVAHLVKDSNYVLGKKPSVGMSPDACLPRNQDDVLVSYLCIALFIGSLLLLFFLPKAD